MRNILSLYVDTSPGNGEELKRLIKDMEQAIRNQFTDEEIEILKDANPTFSRSDIMVTLPVLEGVTGYTKEQISKYRGGTDEVPYHLMMHVRMLHKRVMNDPERARDAVMDWLDRKQYIDFSKL